MKKVVFDIEIYSNYALFSFSDLDNKAFVEFEMYEGKPLDKKRVAYLLKNRTLIGFNSRNFDLPIMFAALEGANNQELKRICDAIIKQGLPSYKTYRQFNIQGFNVDHIDIIEPSPGVGVSLKLYGGRLNSRKLQDLPIEPDELIIPEQRDQLRLYCRNDLVTTAELYKAVENEIVLRSTLSDRYGVDLRSLSDAQMAEAVFKHQLGKVNVKVKKREGEIKPFFYNVPDWVSFESETLINVLNLVKNTQFELSEKGAVILPKTLTKPIVFHDRKYKFGIGGLHSQEKSQAIVCDNNHLLYEQDVSGYYPAIIIEQKLYPKHLSHKFLNIYKANTEHRYKLKTIVNTLNGEEKQKVKTEIACYKIQNNGSYGKFGSKYSYLYSPELMIQTTITGQLALLMLIEKVINVGAQVVSANTDGIVIHCHKNIKNDVDHVCFEWEMLNGYELEETQYKAVYWANVNNYLAIKSGGSKGKGFMAKPSLMKNPDRPICIDAVTQHLINGVAIEDYILNESKTEKFCTVRTVKGGAVFKGQYLGKVVRFYHAKNGDTINYKTNGNKVPKSDNCRPMMDLTEMPKDIDYQWYIDESYKLLKELGC